MTKKVTFLALLPETHDVLANDDNLDDFVNSVWDLFDTSTFELDGEIIPSLRGFYDDTTGELKIWLSERGTLSNHTPDVNAFLLADDTSHGVHFKPIEEMLGIEFKVLRDDSVA
ncbi:MULTISPECIES: hypothetical protein [Lacticaseibacillus]|uniref:Uncharacterized protein n=1 Tax=Lacticaseibacillus hegangensis TaxID=2486010 RepID=A0ABW4CUM4_9LACO|nr:MULTISPECIES: hypothetical protein [Lacticaseibacillus]